MKEPYIGQEVLCPDGLGRITEFELDFIGSFIQVQTYVNDRSCKWAPHNVTFPPSVSSATVSTNIDMQGYQNRVVRWRRDCLGEATLTDKVKRDITCRFLEEALELVRSLGITEKEIQQLTEYTYARPVGEVRQEIGGTMLTLASLCAANGESLAISALSEIERAETPEIIARVRAKNASQPSDSPLPGIE